MEQHNLIVILAGVCGTGKSNVGLKVARKLGIPFFDADKLPVFTDLPQGKLPQDLDPEEWLTSISWLLAKHSARKGCVISCSLLKREHRKTLAAQIDHPLDWVFVKGSYENVLQRAEEMGNQDRPAATLKSDFETLEAPRRALNVDISYSEQELVETILEYLARKYG